MRGSVLIFVLYAPTPKRLDVFIEIFLAIIVKEFLAWLDIPERHNIDACVAYLYLAIRLAGVIDVARLVPLRLSVDSLVLVHLEKVFATTRRLLFL